MERNFRYLSDAHCDAGARELISTFECTFLTTVIVYLVDVCRVEVF